MEIKTTIQIFDGGVNIDGKLAVLTFYDEVTKNRLDGVYGVSGAERSKEDDYKVKQYDTVLGIYREKDKTITTVYGRKIRLCDTTVMTDAKLVDVDKVIRAYTGEYKNKKE